MFGIPSRRMWEGGTHLYVQERTSLTFVFLLVRVAHFQLICVRLEFRSRKQSSLERKAYLGRTFKQLTCLYLTRDPQKPGRRNLVRTMKRGWLEYNIFTRMSREFKIITRIGSRGRVPGKTFRVEVDAKKVTGKIPMPNQRTETLSFVEVVAVTKIFLPPGQHKVRLYLTRGR